MQQQWQQQQRRRQNQSLVARCLQPAAATAAGLWRERVGFSERERRPRVQGSLANRVGLPMTTGGQTARRPRAKARQRSELQIIAPIKLAAQCGRGFAERQKGGKAHLLTHTQTHTHRQLTKSTWLSRGPRLPARPDQVQVRQLKYSTVLVSHSSQPFHHPRVAIVVRVSSDCSGSNNNNSSSSSSSGSSSSRLN